MTTHVPLREIKDDDWDEELDDALDPVEEFMAAAERSGDRGANACAPDVAALGEDAVEDLAYHIRSVDRRSGLPEYGEYARYAAYHLLVTIDTEYAAFTAATILAEMDPATKFFGYALQVAIENPATRLPAALRDLFHASDSRQEREAVCEALASRPERDRETLEILLELLPDSPALGSAFVASYGDAAALPALFDVFDDRSAAPEKVCPACSGILGLHDAIQSLGGELDAERARRLATMKRAAEERAAQERVAKERAAHESAADMRRAWFDPVLAPTQVPARATPRPGPNDPCACGSGKKSKKCCG